MCALYLIHGNRSCEKLPVDIAVALSREGFSTRRSLRTGAPLQAGQRMMPLAFLPRPSVREMPSHRFANHFCLFRIQGMDGFRVGALMTKADASIRNNNGGNFKRMLRMA